jgi:hypothetical protein
MGDYSIWHWFLVLACLFCLVVYWTSLIRILNRAGYSGWWSLLALVPLINIYVIWRFSKASWPATSRAGISNTF